MGIALSVGIEAGGRLERRDRVLGVTVEGPVRVRDRVAGGAQAALQVSDVVADGAGSQGEGGEGDGGLRESNRCSVEV